MTYKVDYLKATGATIGSLTATGTIIGTSQYAEVLGGGDIGNWYVGYKDGDAGLVPGQESYWGGEETEYSAILYPSIGRTTRSSAVDLGSSSTYFRKGHFYEVYRTWEYALSDDRLKTGEVLVENATETLLKLKPQTYDKHTFVFNKLTDEEYSNTSSNGLVFSSESNCWIEQSNVVASTLGDSQTFPWVSKSLSENSKKETGLIAQDIWYDAPELRHIVSVSPDASPDAEKPSSDGGDPQQDPDYDNAGWGLTGASVSYTQLIALLVKSNQELHERISVLESKC
jgi:hypothetical protein